MDTLFSYRYMRVLVATLLGLIILAIAVAVATALNWAPEDNYATINVTGQAERFVVPDIATFNFNVEAKEKEVEMAQEGSAKAMNEIIAYLKEAGVEETDIKTTGYNVNPRYSYTECPRFEACNREQVLEGYTALQNVVVKVRDTENAGMLIGGVGSRGATGISQINFTVDDIDVLREEVRLEAIADARAEAKDIAKELDVRLGDVISFGEGGYGGYYPETHAIRSMEADFAIAESQAVVAPDIALGENRVTAEVTLTYELK